MDGSSSTFLVPGCMGRQVVDGMTTIASSPMLNTEPVVQEHGNPLNLNSSKENHFF